MDFNDLITIDDVRDKVIDTDFLLGTGTRVQRF
ncbi:uncharacterized protein METZ01_LOCUS80717 [marine metagenome]|uniref:Uncharacterized protein n=1 Tax=marine metagenome TaxID=408172 RepID=A0A381UM26_9ZZZZ